MRTSKKTDKSDDVVAIVRTTTIYIYYGFVFVNKLRLLVVTCLATYKVRQKLQVQLEFLINVVGISSDKHSVAFRKWRQVVWVRDQI